jgi:two-component system response regulator DevR
MLASGSVTRRADAYACRIGEESVVVLSLRSVGAPAGPRLSGAEREVLREVARGLSNRAIASNRGVSERTIANQLASASRKLGVSGRSELVAVLARADG